MSLPAETVGSDSSGVDVSLVIALHGEGLLAHPALLAAVRACAAASNSGIRVELVLALDAASAQTRAVVDGFKFDGICQVTTLAARDVGVSRNAAIRLARGQRIAVCDGDDFLSADFIVSASQCLDHMGVGVIVRPELVLYFDNERYVSWQRGSDEPGFDPDCMFLVNPWTSACMADRNVFLQCPYWEQQGAGEGFGFEDWHWNCETLASGLVHVVAARTIHYVRLKASGSLNARNRCNAALLPPSRLFDRLP